MTDTNTKTSTDMYGTPKRRYISQVDGDYNVSSQSLLKYQDEISEIYDLYTNYINPMMIQYEILANSYPVEILNEIRSLTTHMARCTIENTDESIIEMNLSKAKSHVKRAIIDCYKYNCLAFSDYYENFLNQYKKVDLSMIDNGDFILSCSKEYAHAKELLIKAKCSESDNTSTDILYSDYENAYVAYFDLYMTVVNSLEKTERLKLKTEEHEKNLEKEKSIDRRIGVFGLIFGIVGVLIGVLSFL